MDLSTLHIQVKQRSLSPSSKDAAPSAKLKSVRTHSVMGNRTITSRSHYGLKMMKILLGIFFLKLGSFILPIGNKTARL